MNTSLKSQDSRICWEVDIINQMKGDVKTFGVSKLVGKIEFYWTSLMLKYAKCLFVLGKKKLLVCTLEIPSHIVVHVALIEFVI